jgi:hypothetical protein
MPAKKTLSKSRVSDILFLVPFLSGFAIALLAAIFLPQPITGQIYGSLIFSVVLFLWGVSGFVVVIRKEILQGGIRIKGKPAILLGIFMVIVCWPMALFAFYKFIVVLIGNF